ncbi:hypothetical protein [Halobacillus seohaensis]|uniref:Small peptidoglycan-associated lipoprotein n=1 Tax=Halobacillus seohaensis TaxID=447421 RepID=A0ABW2ELT5_9BACI
MVRVVTSILICSFFVFTLSGCDTHGEIVKVISAQPSDYDISLYGHPDNKDQMNDYMSALLNWKTKQEDERFLSFKQSTMNTEDINLSTDQLPALVISKEGKPIQTITGEVSDRNDILNKLESTIALSGNQKNS